MALTGQQIKQLQQALIDAFPSKALLEMMVRIEMNQQLDAIAQGDNQTYIVYKLITWAERTGNVRTLIEGAEARMGAIRWWPGSRSTAAVGRSMSLLSACARVVRTTACRTACRARRAIAFDWVTIPDGEFLMGSDKMKDKLADDDETPQHTLYLPEYCIARVPVTVAQFAAFVKATGYKTTAEDEGSAFSCTGSEWKGIKGADWAHPRGPKSDVRVKQNHPVTCVSWHDAVAFCAWAECGCPRRRNGRRPRAGTDGRIWPWGNREPNSELCNFSMTWGERRP